MVVCETCGVEFKPRRNGRVFCSRNCAQQSPRIREISRRMLLKNPIRPDVVVRPWDGGKRPELSGELHPMWGRSHSPEAILKIKIARARQGRVNVGENNHFWRGGVSKLKDRIYHSHRYKSWRTQVFVRDSGRCVQCGIRSRDAEAHHKIPFSTLLKRNHIKSVEQAIECEALWAVENGETLCLSCHQKTDTYGRKALLVI